ncbi:hypothetical protein [Alienimonas sp. DA493]|uniref:hypothetical protein n=1 Tax=Alienimonas sp. DA493 TaxID=3373605 RepID=UPI0037552F73
MHLYPNGLNNPDEVHHGGWGGRFRREKEKNIAGMSCVKAGEKAFEPYEMHGNTPEGAKAISRWRPDYDNDFAARMEWSVNGDYAAANHHPVAVANGDGSRRVLTVSVAPGATVRLDAAGARDPDDDPLTYSWTYYAEPSSYRGPVELFDASSEVATVAVPADSGGRTLHVVLRVRDSGSPPLTAYRRVVVEVNERRGAGAP